MSSQGIAMMVFIGMLMTLVCAHIQHHHYKSRMHRDLASSTTDYECPVCGMSTMDYNFDNENYVMMENGQTIYTCGMGPQATSDYSFKVRNVEYLAANIAEFIVNPTDADFADCKDTCPECVDGIKDPVTGDSVAADQFVYVCLKNGQKLYFVTYDNRNLYLENVNTVPRYLVKDVICSGTTCPNAAKITTLSAAALSFVAGYSSTASSSSNISTSLDMSATSSDFCVGQGSVMYNGFQTSINRSCVMLIFRPWVLNTAVKYACGFIGCFLIALLNELLAKVREMTRQKLLKARKLRPQDKLHKIQCKLTLAGMYMIQMTVAYFAMLVVMTYETGLFIALIAGFGAGFMLFKNVDLDIPEACKLATSSPMRTKVGSVTSKTNRGTAVKTALKSTRRVIEAVVDFKERAVYVTRSAAVDDLVADIEAVECTTAVANHTK